VIWIRELGLKIQFPRLRNERLADVESAEDNPVCVTKQPSYLENAFFYLEVCVYNILDSITSAGVKAVMFIR
jgi:hypothetical protein